MNIYLNQKKVSIRRQQLIGNGGEAEVYDLGTGQVLKLFKQAHHPDYQASSPLQQAVQVRLQEHQEKLHQLPKGLPDRVIAPQEFAYDRSGRIVGYTMRFLRPSRPLLDYGDRRIRHQGISAPQVTAMLLDLHQTVAQIHQQGMIIGDFNDLNLLVQDHQAYFIDVDSFQFGSFPCRVFTERFLDPQLCNHGHQLCLDQPYRDESDWYAFTVMVMQCLLFVHPYGGVYQPKNPTHKIPQGARSLHRISIFDPQVRYPKPALPLHCLPEAILDYFEQVFRQDQRGVFPQTLLRQLRWQTCPTCGLDHAKPTCPNCFAQLRVIAPPLQSGTLHVKTLFQTQGIIVTATVQGDQLCWLYHDHQGFHREDGAIVGEGTPAPHLEFMLHGAATLISNGGQLVLLGDRPHLRKRFGLDPCHLPGHSFAGNDRHYYWIHQGQLLRGSPMAPVYMGDVLLHQTAIWVGPFGLGLYRMDTLTTLLIFDCDRPGIKDHLTVPAWPGQLLTLHCCFSGDRAWLFATSQCQGKRHYHLLVIQAQGHIEASLTSDQEDHWLASRGSCPIADQLFVPTDAGILRLELQQGHLQPTRLFTETEPFVNSHCQLLPARQGLYGIHPQSIQYLQIL
ncbi:hypothetical protein L3556_07090 [Candidatus Synechococcus calcipolaris G9]|uniref:Protein kinase domain-containing protein n=1 Tax=Candidatus Synechococcus calcipolaris G9 TaxID=1497997 RepID=A0ABT6EYM7_9SYNE|nr:hypothetical protein [Candidatus Synechococcus calcipolaris]MDG2990698.1 hypothetical protein [Candidatus Synechococcus calcipolaris G9]